MKTNRDNVVAFLESPLGTVTLEADEYNLTWTGNDEKTVALAEKIVPLSDIPRSGGNPVAWAIHRLEDYLGGFSRVLIEPKEPEKAKYSLAEAFRQEMDLRVDRYSRKPAPGQKSMWDEGAHPRGQPDNSGQFAEKEGAKPATETQEETHDQKWRRLMDEGHRIQDMRNDPSSLKAYERVLREQGYKRPETPPTPKPATLTPDEIGEIEDWTLGQDVNRWREWDVEQPRINPVTQPKWAARYRRYQQFCSAVAKLPPYKGTIYRGISGLTKADLDKMEQDGMVVGGTLTFKSHSSSSKDRDVADDFTTMTSMKGIEIGVLFEISAKTGADIQRYAIEEFEYQKEVLIRPNTKYRVESVSKPETVPMGGHGEGEYDAKIYHVRLTEL
jgi:hypothetical protein